MDVHVAFCHNPNCRVPVVPNEKGKCPACDRSLQIISSLTEMIRLGISIPPIFLVSTGTNGSTKLTTAALQPVPHEEG